MHRSNRDYSEIARNPKILDTIDHTYAPLLGAEWGYLRPGILASFTYERSQLEAALLQNTEVLGLIGPEYKNVREHLLSNLPGDRAWRYDKSQYPSLQNRRNQER